jgi:hypothetical protein
MLGYTPSTKDVGHVMPTLGVRPSRARASCPSPGSLCDGLGIPNPSSRSVLVRSILRESFGSILEGILDSFYLYPSK